MTKNTPPDSDDPADIARRFVDLWQDQLSAMASDPSLTKGAADAMTVWQQMMNAANPSAGQQAPNGVGHDQVTLMTATMSAWQNALTKEGQGDEQTHQDQTTANQPQNRSQNRSEASRGSCERSDELLRELLERLTRIEERLDRLEPGPESAGGRPDSPAAKPGKKAKSRKAAGKRPAGKRST